MPAEKVLTGGNFGRNKKEVSIKAAPLEKTQTFAPGTNIAGSTVKLADGTDYQMKGASSGIQEPQVVPNNTIQSTPEPIKPLNNNPVQPTPTPVNQGDQAAPVETPTQTTPTPSVSGIDTAALKAAGADDATIAKIMELAKPKLAGQDAQLNNAKELLDVNSKSLEEENKTIQDTYSAQKQAEKDLAAQKEQLINDSAQVQAGTLEQQKAAEQHTIEQEKARFELARSREERGLQEQNIKNEDQTSRALASSLGLAFSSFGTAKIMEVRQKGEQILSDARAETAYGQAEFAFRIQDIERNYGNDLNRVESSRRDLQIQNLTALNEGLKGIDEKALLSMSEKKEAGRKLVKDYFDSKDKIDSSIADIKSDLVKGVYDEVEKVKKDKQEAETADLDLSGAYGYFVNKWGKPVNTQLNGQPTPFMGGYDKEMSAQFGYLVSKSGQAIRDDKGNKITYEDPDMAAFKSALSAYSKGETLDEGSKASLNMKVGTNSVIAGALVKGKYYPSKRYPGYGLQCGEYINDQFLKTRQLGSDYANADALIKSSGSKPGDKNFSPKVGDVMFMNYGDPKIPHKAIIEGVDADGNITITDANRAGKGVVDHGFKIMKDSSTWKRIYGVATLPLKEGVLLGQPIMTTNTSTDGPSPTNDPNKQMINKLMLAAAAGKAGISDTMLKEIMPKAASAGSDAGQAGSFDEFLESSSDIKSTDGQKKAAGFAYQALDAEQQFSAYEKAGVPINTLNTTAARVQPIPWLQQAVPMNQLIENIQSPRERDIMSARLNWVVDVLRPASGASISVGEYESNYSQYFPGPSATPTEVANAKKRREASVNGLLLSTGKLGPALKQYMKNNNTGYEVANSDAAPVVAQSQKASNTASNALQDATNFLQNGINSINGNTPTPATEGISEEERNALKAMGYTDEEINAM